MTESNIVVGSKVQFIDDHDVSFGDMVVDHIYQVDGEWWARCVDKDGDSCHFLLENLALVPKPDSPGPVVSDGGPSAYYIIPDHATELKHLISHKEMSFARGNIFKACYRLGEKRGTDVLYDLNKIKFFVEDLIDMYHRGEAV